MIALLALLGCGPESAPLDLFDPTFVEVWVDEFDGPAGSPVNPDHWNYDVGGDGWGNNQLEFNTDRTENSFLNGEGALVIRAIKEDYQGNTWTSARLTTLDKVEFGYGRWEADIRFPAGEGLWPAFWLLGSNFPEIGWPGCGEVDIIELNGGRPYEAVTTVHGPDYNGGGGVGEVTLSSEAYTDRVFNYAVEIDPEHIAWYIDGRLVHKVNPGTLPSGAPWVFTGEHFAILNLAVGGNFVSPPDDTTPTTADVLVERVRFLERVSPPVIEVTEE